MCTVSVLFLRAVDLLSICGVRIVNFFGRWVFFLDVLVVLVGCVFVFGLCVV